MGADIFGRLDGGDIVEDQTYAIVDIWIPTIERERKGIAKGFNE